MDSSIRSSDAVARIIAALRDEAAAAEREARETYAAATDADSRAENKYDTRSLEASYLARGQAQRVAELNAALAAFEVLPSATGGVVGPGALVRVGEGREADWYFIGPAAGGTVVAVAGVTVMVVTPASPLGRKLIGLPDGGTIAFGQGRSAMRVQVVR